MFQHDAFCPAVGNNLQPFNDYFSDHLGTLEHLIVPFQYESQLDFFDFLLL
jgi:hypothetical protein